MSADTEAQLARWAERDAAVGLAAELEQSRAQLRERDTEVANLRERGARLAQRVAQLTAERDRLGHQVASLQQPTFTARASRRSRSLAGRVLRRLRG